MNLNKQPTIEQLKEIISACDDNAGHHILWVSKDGEVRIDIIPIDQTPIGFVQQTEEMKIRYETYSQGKGWVGQKAAEDTKWMSKLYNSLIKEWEEKQHLEGTHYVDGY